MNPKKNHIILTLLLCFLLTAGMAQKPTGNTFGGALNEQGICFDLTGDNGFIIAGNTRSMGAGSNDIYLVKVNQFGMPEWEYSYGIQYHDFGMWVEQTRDMGFIVTGYKWGQGHGGEDVVLLKTDAFGEQQWKKYIGHQHRDQGFCVRELSDGYIITGHTMSYTEPGDIYAVRTDTEGNVIWDNYFGTNQIDYSYDITPAPDGQFLIAGTMGGFYNVDLTIFRIPDCDALLVRINGEGEQVWQKLYGGDGHDWFWSVSPSPQEGYYCLGSTQSYGWGSFDMYLVKIDDAGEELWYKTFGGSRFDYGQSLSVAPDGNLYLLGTTQSFGQNGSTDLYLVKTDPLGEKIWELVIGGDYSDYGHCVRATPEGGCVILGDYQWADETKDIYLIRIDSLGNIISLGSDDDLAGESNLFIYPNPFTSQAMLLVKDSSALKGYDLMIFNQNGQLVEQTKNLRSQSVPLKRRHMEPGSYYIKISFPDTPGKVLVGTFIVY
ncbi:MAG: T9SS type A sorting domain-containing protein [Bacteroidales bacterium]|nr:T9SS type A sorting domain-containing protein [Bacteroidales bacterium]